MATRADREVVLTALRQIDPDDFEEFVADLWASEGWNTRSTPYTGDDGIDVDGERSDPDFETVGIQVKRNAPDNKVSNSTVQRLYAAANDHRDYDEVLVVATGEFSSKAYEYAYKNDLTLVNGSELVDKIFENDRFDLLDEYSVGGFESGWVDQYSESEETAADRSDEVIPPKPKTKLSGYFLAVVVLAMLTIAGWPLVLNVETQGIGALFLFASMIGSPIAVGLDAIHLRRYDGNYQPSLLWAYGAFLTIGHLGIWYAARRGLRTDLRAAFT